MDQVTQDLRQLGGAELAGSAGAVREQAQADAVALIVVVAHGREEYGKCDAAARVPGTSARWPEDCTGGKHTLTVRDCGWRPVR